MSTGSDAPVDPRFASLDASATIDLCSSLADYGEAGGLSRDLMMQVGLYAESRYGDDLEVLLAAARMYIHGGEAERARSALVRAGRLGIDAARVIPLLDKVLDTLADPRTAEQVLRDAPSDPPLHFGAPPPASSPPALPRAPAEPFNDGASVHDPRPKPRAPTEPMRASRPQAAATTPRARIADAAPRGASPIMKRPTPGLSAFGVDRPRSYTPTTPMMRMPGHGPSKPTTPIARQGHSTPTPTGQAAAVAEEQEALSQSGVTPRASAQPVRTEISRRVDRAPESSRSTGAHADHADAGSSPPPPSVDAARSVSRPEPISVSLPPRIRILDADDERRKLDPYELIGELASGGMATVYLGRLAGAGGFSRFVAIKQLHPHLAREEQFVQMFLDEARLAAGIHNAHVVPILEVGMSKAGYFLVMEFIEGDTLAGLTVRASLRGDAPPSSRSGALHATPPALPAPVAIRVVLDALVGLHAAHQLTDAEGVHLGLVHRDCTPQNILVGVDGSARLTDFGVARAASRLAITRPQQVKGKVAYLSPEQAHAMDLDRRSDIFTMGIVLWEALSGRALFRADTDAATLSRVVSGPIPAVRSFVPDLPPELDAVCRRALHRDRNKRFRTAAEMADALEQAAAAEGFAGAASPRELGRYVEATMGADLIAQREAVRAGLAPGNQRGHAPPSVRGSVPGAAPPTRDPAEPRAVTPEAPPASPKPEPVAAVPPADPALAPTLPASPAPADLARDKAEAAAPEGPEPAPAAAPKAASGPAAAPGSSLAERVKRFTGSRMSTARGATLAVLLVVILTAPIWLKATDRILGRRAHPAARHPAPPLVLDAPSAAPAP